MKNNRDDACDYERESEDGHGCKDENNGEIYEKHNVVIKAKSDRRAKWNKTAGMDMGKMGVGDNTCIKLPNLCRFWIFDLWKTFCFGVSEIRIQNLDKLATSALVFRGWTLGGGRRAKKEKNGLNRTVQRKRNLGVCKICDKYKTINAYLPNTGLTFGRRCLVINKNIEIKIINLRVIML